MRESDEATMILRERKKREKRNEKQWIQEKEKRTISDRNEKRRKLFNGMNIW